MLLLCDCEHNEPALSDVLLHLCIPGRHGLAATPSPGGEVDEQHFLTAKLRQRYGRPVHDVRQGEIRVKLTDAGRVGRCARCGDRAKTATSQSQQIQISHRSTHIHSQHYGFSRNFCAREPWMSPR
jgi:hypothetical protein